MDTTALLGNDMSVGESPAASYQRLYSYWLRKGWLCILVSQICDLIVSAFILLLFMFLTSAIDYRALWSRVEHTICPGEFKNTSPLYETDCWGVRVVNVHGLAHMHPLLMCIVIICIVLWFTALADIVRNIPMLLHSRRFYKEKLAIEDRDISTIPWNEVLHRLVLTSTRTELQIIHCITRVDDFDTGLFNDNIITPVLWIPGLGHVVYLPEDLRWYIHYSLRKAIETPSYGDVGETAANLSWRLRFLALVSFLAAPFLVVYRIALCVFQYADEWRRKPSLLTTRQWSPWARAKLRNYCELPHDIDHRLDQAEKVARKYLQGNPSELVTILAKSIILVCGGVLSVNIVLAFVYDEEYLALELTPNRSVAFWMGVAGVIITTASSFLPSESLDIHERQQNYNTMTRLLQCDIPEKEFYVYYQYRIVLLLHGVLSAILTPIALMWVIAPQAGDIARYLEDNTRTCILAGPVCRHALFEMESMAGGDKVQTSLIEFRKQYQHWKTENRWQSSIIDSVTLNQT